LLIQLHIRNFAVIADLRLDLGPGLTVISGEEGAGKSLLVDALGTLLGARAMAGLVRRGAEAATVEAVFQPDGELNTRLAETLAASAITPETDGTILLSREVQEHGRSLGRINGRAVPLSLLKEAGGQLLDLHSQMEFLSLLDAARQRDLLDNFGKLDARKAKVATAVETLREKTRQLQKKNQPGDESAADFLRYQWQEIERAGLSPDEDETLPREAAVLRQAQLIKESCDGAYQYLYGDENSAYNLVHQAVSALREAGRVDAALTEHIKALETAVAGLEDGARELRQHGEKLTADAARLEEIEQRLHLIASLKRKHGGSITSILAAAAGMKAELEALDNREAHLAKLTAEQSTLKQAAAALAEELSRQRRRHAAKLNEMVNEEMAALELPHARFAVSVTQSEQAEGLPGEDGRLYAFTRAGIDRVEFTVSTNPGEVMRPLAEIASGGETSRIILAIKSALKRADPVPTLVFDEVDMGIGGRSGDSIGRKLTDLARYHQVLCVTHLPQIACFGDTHFRLVKDTTSGRAVSRVESVSGEARIAELAAMLGAANAPDTLNRGAGEMLERASAWKAQQRRD